MRCKNCGQEISGGSEFCISCGAGVKTPEITGRQTKDTVGNPNKEIETLHGESSVGGAKSKKWYTRPWLYIAAAVVIAVTVLALTGIGADIVTFVLEGPTVPITFDSPELEAAVRAQLDIWDRDVTNKDAKDVTELKLEGCGISGIEALAQFKDLTSLSLKSNQVSDISPLAELTGLTQLNLQENLITDITALSELSGLTDLQLSGNRISDISVLSGMTALNKLYLDNNQIISIGALVKLEGLKELDLSNNKIIKVDVLSGLSSLESVNLNKNQVSDIGPLSGLTGVKDIGLADNKISDISVLAGCGCLTKLTLQNDPIEDISPASRMKALKSIDIKGTKVIDISGIAGKVTIDMDQPKTINISLMPGEYFMIENLKLPIETGGAKIKWSSLDTSIVTVERDGKIQATNKQPDAGYNSMMKAVILEGKIENTNTGFRCTISVKHDRYKCEWDEKKTKYKYGGWITTGYPTTIDPALENVIGVDLYYNVKIKKGKAKMFTLRSLVNGKWKNFGAIDISKGTEGTIHIDFEGTVKISKYWLVPTEKKTARWNASCAFSNVYYESREADLGDLQVGAESV